MPYVNQDHPHKADAIFPALSLMRTGGGSDLAFAVMVLAAYFTMFSTIHSISVGVLLVMIVLGVLYISLGVYGYAFVAQRANPLLRTSYFAAQVILGSSIIYLSGGVGFNAMILLPLAGHSVVLLPEGMRYITNAAIASVCSVIIRMLTGGWDQVWTTMPIFVAGQLFILVFTQMAVSEEQARHEVQGLVHELEEANRQLRAYALQAEDLAVSKERNRMAREIHDGLGHHLTALNMQIKAARAVLSAKNEARTGELLANAESLTQKALVDVRQSVFALRENVSDVGSLPDLVMNVVKICEANGITVEFNVIGSERFLSAQVSLTIIRTAQECVNNALKHSHASNMALDLDYTSPDVVSITYRDNGVGSDNLEGGFGLIGMKERVQLLDGKIEIRSARDHGFFVHICLPG